MYLHYIFGFLCLWAGTFQLLLAQTTEKESAQFSLSTPMGFVGEEVRLPLYFEGRVSGDTRSFSVRLQYPSSLLRFVRVEEGFLLEGSGVSLKSDIEVVEGEAESTALLLKLTPQASRATRLPEGLLLYLHFQIEAATPLGVEIPLTNSAHVSVSIEGEIQELPANFPDGIISVSPREKENRLLFGCFFYMH